MIWLVAEMSAQSQSRRRLVILFDDPYSLADFLAKIGVEDAYSIVDNLLEEAYISPSAIPGGFDLVVLDDSIQIKIVGGEYNICGGPACILASKTIPLKLDVECRDNKLFLNNEVIATCDEDCYWCVAR